MQTAWSRKALPVITWMSGDGDGSASDPYLCRLDDVVTGKWDSYLLAFAGSILATNLPVVIRFDHEMNGNWYDWSGGRVENAPSNNPCDPSLNNPLAPNLYVQAWQHIWNVFNSVGANSDVIWAWTPDRVDGLGNAGQGLAQPAFDPVPGGSGSASAGDTSLSQDYPGDKYVDWLGMSGYAWNTPTASWTYATTFAKTLAQLETLPVSNGTKPIFIAEAGASQVAYTTSGSGVDFDRGGFQRRQEFVDHPDTVGLPRRIRESSASPTSTTIPTQATGSMAPRSKPTGSSTASPQTLAAFAAGVSNVGYSSGIMPDGLGA